MRNKGFDAHIDIKPNKKFTDKVFLRKTSVTDPLNGCPNEVHIYIPVPTRKYPDKNIQIWFRNGAGKMFMRFENPEDLINLLKKLESWVSSDECEDAWSHAQDLGFHAKYDSD